MRLLGLCAQALDGGRSVAQFLPKCWGSFSSSSLVTWAAQVVGGDEPPSVLSDNLSKVWLIARPLSLELLRAISDACSDPGRVHASKLVQLAAQPSKYHKLISQTVALRRSFALR